MQLAGKTLHVCTRFLTLEWVHKSKSLFGRAVQFAVLLSPWHLKVQRVKEHDVVFAQLLQSSITNFVDLEESLAPLAPASKGSPTIRMDPAMLYARLPRDYRGFVVSFDGSAKSEKYGGYGSGSWVLWGVPEWKIVIAANAYLPSTTTNVAKYTGMNNGVKAAIVHGAEDFFILGDSRLAIQQSLWVISCRKESLLTLLNIHKALAAQLRSVKYLYLAREYNAAADSLATEALESKVCRVVVAETRKSELVTLNRIQEMIYESDEDTAEAVPREAKHHVHILTGSELSQQKPFEHFVRDDTTIENDGVANESSFDERSSSHPSNTVPPATLDAEDIDPVAIQRERPRRIAAAQDEEKWWNLKKVLRGQAETLNYKEARGLGNMQAGSTRKETPFYLVHVWDAQSTLRAMSSSLKRGSGRQSDALEWRRDVNRQHEIALTMAKDYQAAEKKRLTKEHNKALSRLEKGAVPRQGGEERSADSPEAS
ncbi:hypothetical protein PC110_g9898 [Phytophthora cactorum]|uniref:RNase H type-1 domain-containing protein n=2 Tax=Phytophthora cactorum TaxID=29920 RepID=A0A329SCS8_9STRA|nr:hypothetical protein PC110_g9898 [Phytophthora cactorum]